MINRYWQFRGNRNAALRGLALGAFLSLLVGVPHEAAGQDIIQSTNEQTITIQKGATAIITPPGVILEVDIADENIARQRTRPPDQVLVYGWNVGSTTLILFMETGAARFYSIEVTADVASFRSQVDELFPGSGLRITSTGSSVVLSGEVRDPSVVRKAMELAEAEGIRVVNNVEAPAPEQILLHVEFAEVAKSTLHEVGGDLLRILNPETLDHAFDEEDTHQIEMLSEGFVNLLVEGDNSRLDAVIRALKNTGEFRSLAQPNLVTREGEEATFLAGGEFPFPTIQGSQGNNAVSIQWKEFGIRLAFTPEITNTGNIRLQVAPEVSSLDFANGLTFQGFQIPSVLARRVETDVELRPGQTLAIGGLVDNELITGVDKIPLLGDIPILGFFFRSEAARQDRTELLVLVTPHILDADNLPAGPLPTGNAEDWDWDSHIRNWIQERSGSGQVGSPAGSGGS